MDDGAGRSRDDELSSADAWLKDVAHAPNVALADLVGRSLGRYRVTSVLGRGAMGIVYLAEDEKLGRVVALKVLPSTALGDADRRRRFLREARLAAALNHPNIATVYDAGEIDDRIFIAMEHVPGPTLRAALAAGPLAPRDVVRLGTDIARGLAAAHDAKIVHRDVKPDNVVVHDGVAKVLDFGMAKQSFSIDVPETDSTQTQDGRLVGTPAYMSPEQAKGRPVDARSDVFSLGVTLYEMATGERPFAGETTLDVLIAIDRDHPPRASQRARGVPPALDRLIARCLEKDPEKRFPSAVEVARALSELPPSRWPHAGIFALVVLALGAGVFTLARTRAPIPATSPPDDPRGFASPVSASVPSPGLAAPLPAPVPAQSVTVPAPAAPTPQRAEGRARTPASVGASVTRTPSLPGPLEEPK